jgi:hypothetical protein
MIWVPTTQLIGMPMQEPIVPKPQNPPDFSEEYDYYTLILPIFIRQMPDALVIPYHAPTHLARCGATSTADTAR